MIRVSGNALKNIKERWQGRALAVLGRRPCRETGKVSILRPQVDACAIRTIQYINGKRQCHQANGFFAAF